MDKTKIKICRLEDQDEAFCLSLSPSERIGVLEELNRQGRILAGYPRNYRLNRSVLTVIR